MGLTSRLRAFVPPAQSEDQFPWRSIIVAAGTTFLYFVLAAIGFASSIYVANTMSQRVGQAMSAAGEVRRLDEVLTMSANMAAQTGVEQWRARYDANVPELDKAFAAIIAAAPPGAEARFAATTKAANDHLIAAETASLDNAKAGRLIEAQRILQSDEYAANKRIYAKGVDELLDAVHARVHAETRTLTIVTIVAMVLMLLGGAFIARCWFQLIATLKRWRQAMDDGAARLEAVATEQRRQAEHVRRTIDVVGEALAALASGDLTARIDAQVDGEFASLRDDFNVAAEQLQGSIASVVSSVASIRSGSAEIARAAEDLARRTEMQAAGVEETSASLEQTATSVQETARAAEQASLVAAAAQAAAREGCEAARDTSEAMKRVRAASARIEEAVEVINAIAFKTDILALNAGVEAARAGEAGRGFEVVAGEVRALASSSGRAAAEIRNLVAEARAEVEEGVRLAAHAGEATLRMAGEVDTISSLFDAVARSAQDQSSALARVSEAVESIETATQSNAAMVEEASAASRTLAEEAQVLSQNARFKISAESGPPSRAVLRRAA